MERIRNFRSSLSDITGWKKEMIKFVLIGSSGAMLDATLYTIGLKFFGLYPSVAKAIAYLSGTFLVYTISKRWTYKRKERSHREMIKFFIVYGSSFFANVGANKLGIILFDGIHIHEKIDPYLSNYRIAWFFATAVSAIINFTGQKFFVFTNRRKVENPEPEPVEEGF